MICYKPIATKIIIDSYRINFLPKNINQHKMYNKLIFIINNYKNYK